MLTVKKVNCCRVFWFLRWLFSLWFIFWLLEALSAFEVFYICKFLQWMKHLMIRGCQKGNGLAICYSEILPTVHLRQYKCPTKLMLGNKDLNVIPQYFWAKWYHMDKSIFFFKNNTMIKLIYVSRKLEKTLLPVWHRNNNNSLHLCCPNLKYTRLSILDRLLS